MMTPLDFIPHKSGTNKIRCKYHCKGIEWFVKGPNNQDACNRGSQYTNDLEQ